MKIGELAGACSVSSQTIRYYERRGLLALAKRDPNGYRSYDERAIERVRFIQRAQASGLTLAEIAGIIQVRADGSAPCAHVDGLLRSKLTEVDSRLRELRELRCELIELLERSATLDPADCGTDEICHILSA